MVKLGDLLDIIWTVTELNVIAYDNNRLQHKWIIGEHVKEIELEEIELPKPRKE